MTSNIETLEQLADYIDTCVHEAFDFNRTPIKFDSLSDLIEAYYPMYRYFNEVALLRTNSLCSTKSILRLIK